MFGLIVIAIVSLLSGAIGAGEFYDCSRHSTVDACVESRWCIWNQLATSDNCIYDKCLAWVSDTATKDNCPTTGVSCELYYLTDTHDCTTGAALDQTNRFCRSSSDAILKKPVDACFYQDLKSRFDSAAPGTVSPCSNIAGGITCKKVTTNSDSIYCYATDAIPCSDYFDDVIDDNTYLSGRLNGVPKDLVGFCGCLGTDYCNLYPFCALNKTGSLCVPDPCAQATSITGATCTGNGLGGCVAKVAQKVNSAGTGLADYTICVSGSTSTVVKENDWNECYFGIQASLSYPNANTHYPECATVTEVSKCVDIYANDSTAAEPKMCQSVPIAANYFLAKEGNYCTDGGPNHTPPSPDAALKINVPTLFATLLSLAFVVLAL